jgi:hypothetical protein
MTARVRGLVVLLAACKSPEPARESKPVEPAPAPAPVAAREATPAAHTPTTDPRVLVSKMQLEAANRPKAGVLAEPLFDALEAKADIKLAERRQYLGATLHAAFCAGGNSVDHVTVAMCEYADDKAAQVSLDYMNQYFPVGAKGERRMHHAAVMTVVAANKTDPRVAKAMAAFESM